MVSSPENTRQSELFNGVRMDTGFRWTDELVFVHIV